MSKFQELLGDIDSNDFEQVKTLLLSLKSQKVNGSPGLDETTITIDDSLPLSEAFCKQAISKSKLKDGVRSINDAKTKQMIAQDKRKKLPGSHQEKGSEKEAKTEIKPIPNSILNAKNSFQLRSLEGNQHVSRSVSSKNSQVLSTTGTQSLTAFGFFRSPIKSNDRDKKKLFSSFVQDKRNAPPRLRFWDDISENTETRCQVREETPLPITNSTDVPFDPFLSLREEDSSLLHLPIPCSNRMEAAKISERQVAKLSFAELIEASNHSHRENFSGAALCDKKHVKNATGEPTTIIPILRRSCSCPFHASHIPSYYVNFDNEVLFCGFYSIGYDPFLARPPYFGSYNHFVNENISELELLRLARFPVDEEPPRFSTLDYEYDSGDDWDLLEGDEEIGSSVDEEDEEMSLSSSDFDFINDNQEDSDSDDELQRTMIDARERRKKRLRGKDKLIPSFSGPFLGILPHEHPLQQYDRMECFASPLERVHSSCATAGMSSGDEQGRGIAQSESDIFETVLKDEVELFGGVGKVHSVRQGVALDQEELETVMKHKLQEAALKNRREMSADELEALHLAISLNSRASSKVLLEILRSQHLCVGVAQIEFKRTLKRFYEKKHGMLIRREIPWDPTDDRLFTCRNHVDEETAGIDGETKTGEKLLETVSEEKLHQSGKNSSLEENQIRKGPFSFDSLLGSSPSVAPFREQTTKPSSSGMMQLENEDPHHHVAKKKLFLKRSRSTGALNLKEKRTIFDLINRGTLEPS